MDENLSADCAVLAILPGLMCDSRLFAAQLARFPGAVVVDGFYGGARSLPAMAAHALAELPPRVRLVGHSMGGRVALEILRRAPERVAGVVLASTGVHPVRAGEADARHALRNLGRRAGMAALVGEWLPPMIAPARRGDCALTARLAAMCGDAGLAIYEAQIEALLARPEVESLLPGIACPALVITGEEDRWAPPAQHAVIAAAIPGAELAIIAGAGHMLPAEDPEAFNAALAQWLAAPLTPQPTR